MNLYTVYIYPGAWKEIKNLRGHMRHRVKQTIDALANDPRPSNSIALETPNFGREARRLRLDRWRIVYVVTEDEFEQAIDVLTVRKRPPYDYEDLEELLAQV